jgi:hypothetical protein
MIDFGLKHKYSTTAANFLVLQLESMTMTLLNVSRPSRVKFLLPLFVILCSGTAITAFVRSSITCRPFQRQRPLFHDEPMSSSAATLHLPPIKATSHIATRLYQEKKNNKKQVAADGTQRGAFLLGAVLLACVWIFSIPPEFRRAYLCGSERCVQNRSAYLCNDCMTPDEWRQGIVDYYKNGGGVKFDFSIDPNSKMKF